MRQRGFDRQAATGWARNHLETLPIVDVDKSAVGRMSSASVPSFGLERFLDPFKSVVRPVLHLQAGSTKPFRAPDETILAGDAVSRKRIAGQHSRHWTTGRI
jgi:hypothetical protein